MQEVETMKEDKAGGKKDREAQWSKGQGKLKQRSCHIAEPPGTGKEAGTLCSSAA